MTTAWKMYGQESPSYNWNTACNNWIYVPGKTLLNSHNIASKDSVFPLACRSCFTSQLFGFQWSSLSCFLIKYLFKIFGTLLIFLLNCKKHSCIYIEFRFLQGTLMFYNEISYMPVHFLASLLLPLGIQSQI